MTYCLKYPKQSTFSIIIISTLIFFLGLPKSYAQSAYELSWKHELPYIGLGIGSLITGQYLIKNDPYYSIEELADVSMFEVNSFDRPATGNFSKLANSASDGFVYGIHIAPYLFLAGEKSRKEFGAIMTMYGEAAAINLGITLFTKNLTKRPRPYIFNSNVPDEFKTQWVYKCTEGKLLEKVNPHEFYYYAVSNMPYPIKDRDMVMHCKQWKDASGVIYSSSTAVPTFIPATKDRIRIPYFKSEWKITPLSEDRILVDYTAITNPGGSLPAWIVNLAVTTGPLKTIQQLIKTVN